MKRFFNKDITKRLPKLCIDCKYFIGDNIRWPDESPDHTNFGKCKLFGKTDLVTGDIKYEYARLAREDDTMCGKRGKFFEKHLDV
jgi:hypothetical protein